MFTQDPFYGRWGTLYIREIFAELSLEIAEFYFRIKLSFISFLRKSKKIKVPIKQRQNKT